MHAYSREGNTKRHWFIDILLLIFFIGTAFAFMLGSRPLNVPDEARYSEVAREMLVTKDFITPRLNGIKYFEKPALFYWMQAFALKIAGLNEWACRLVNALIALLGCLATYFTARKLFNRKTGLFSAMILASSLLYFALAHVVTLDMTVSVFLSLSLFSFMLGVYVSRAYFYGLYIFAGLAVLTKGLIGIIFPGSIIFLWLLLTHQWKILKSCYFFRGILLFLLITLPWHILVQLRNPEFFHFYFIDQQFTRYLTLEAHRYQPNWYYIPVLLIGIFPWTGFLYGSLKNLQWAHPKDLFFLLSTAIIFVFFSFSHSKLIPYILPCLLPLSIILGKYFSSENPKYLWAGFMTIFFANVALAMGLVFYIYADPITSYFISNIRLVNDVATDIIQLKKWATILITILFINAVLVPWIFYKKDFKIAFITQIICSTLFLLSLSATVPYIYMDSIKNMALDLKSTLQPQDMVANLDYYYQDLPFYLNRTVTIINWDGELEFGQHYAHDKNLMIKDTVFWPLWESPHIIYMMIAKDLLHNLEISFPQYHFYAVTQSKHDVVVTNHPQEDR